MKAVIQCAGRKEKTAETFALNGVPQTFVAKPSDKNQVCPWDEIPTLTCKTWIDCAHAFRNQNGRDTFEHAGVSISGSGRLTECGRLYLPVAYSALISRLGKENVYILSAGWGLVRADAVIPTYNITFSEAPKVPMNARVTPEGRSKSPSISDDMPGDDEIHFFMTPNYLEYWFQSLSGVGGDHRRFVFHWKKGARNLPAGIHEGNAIWHELGGMKTNWHYAAVNQFLNGTE